MCTLVACVVARLLMELVFQKSQWLSQSQSQPQPWWFSGELNIIDIIRSCFLFCVSAVISACEKGGEWQQALSMLDDVQLLRNISIFCICLCLWSIGYSTPPDKPDIRLRSPKYEKKPGRKY